MKNGNAKEYLLRARYALMMADKYERKSAMIRQQIQLMEKHGESDNIADLVKSLQEAEEGSTKERTMWLSAYDEIESAINQMMTPLYIELLSLCYLDGLSLNRISQQSRSYSSTYRYIPYSTYGYIRNMHGKALMEFSEVLEIKAVGNVE